MIAKALKTETGLIVGGVVVAALALWWLTRKGNAAATGAAVGGAAVDLAGGAIAGAATGLGQTVGIPATNQGQCAIDMANGSTWAASFSCPAATFIKYIANGMKPPAGQ